MRGFEKFSFIARMPDEPGSLRKLSKIVKQYNGNINRIHFDRRIDPRTVFFEVTATDESHEKILADLCVIGYLQTSLVGLSSLKFYVYLPHRSGALFEFLNYITFAEANVVYINFDDMGSHPGRLTVSLNVENSTTADDLLNRFKLRYRLEIVEYDTTGKNLDDTVFYLRFAQNMREFFDDPEDAFLLNFLQDINHIVQELGQRGEDPKRVFESVLQVGRILNRTTGRGFYADVQRIAVTDEIDLFAFQMPAGGNIFLFRTSVETVMIDTGYAIYHNDVIRMFQRYGLGDLKNIRRIIVTHADADHCGAVGYFDAEIFMHPGTLKIIETINRAYGSRSEESILEMLYTKMINLFSRFRFKSSREIKLFSADRRDVHHVFPLLDSISIGGLKFEVLESLGGHQYGQIFLCCHDHGLLFAADSIINFDSLTEERRDYNTLAVILMTSVNVDSELAGKERKALFEMAAKIDKRLRSTKKRCLICGGHGAVSVLSGSALEAYGAVERYVPEYPTS